MNHPNVEEMIEFLYGEASPARHAQVAQHLSTCAECQERMASWCGVRRDLAGWEIAPGRPMPLGHAATDRTRGLVRWAVAAMVLIGTGFGLARLLSPPPTPDRAALRAELARDLNRELERKFAANWAKYEDEQTVRQQAFRQAVVQAVNQLELRQLVVQTNLRKDVETVALYTQEEFDRLTADAAAATR